MGFDYVKSEQQFMNRETRRISFIRKVNTKNNIIVINKETRVYYIDSWLCLYDGILKTAYEEGNIN